jgi:ABC-2 type transport system permease protein
MTAMIRAELTKLARPRVLLGAAVAAALFAVVAALTVFAGADPAATATPGRGPTLEQLAGPGGGSRAFATGASFVGLFVFVTFIANVAVEFSSGTLRTLLMRQPGRVRLLAGKMVALLLFVAGVLVVAEVLTLVVSTAMAPTQDVATTEWFGLSGLGHAAADYLTALSAATSWALLGMALAVFVRSTPLALGIGIAWAGPFEHLLQDAWTAASDWFPGLLIESVAAGGTPDVSFARAALLVAVYVSLAAAAAFTVFSRRDVTF